MGSAGGGHPLSDRPNAFSALVSASLRGISSFHCLQHQKSNSLPSHNLPHSYFRLHPLPVLSLKSEGPHMTKRVSDKQLAANRSISRIPGTLISRPQNEPATHSQNAFSALASASLRLCGEAYLSNPNESRRS